MVKVKFLKQRKQDIIFDIVVTLISVVCFIVLLYPLIYVVSASITDAEDVLTGKMWLFPTKLTFSAYEYVFSNERIWLGFYNALIYTAVGTVLSLAVIFLAAYPLSRPDFALKGFLLKFYTFTMYFGGGMIPYFLLIVKLGWYNTPLPLIIPTAVNVWNMIIIKTYFSSNIPQELLWAAQVDGASNVRFFLSIALRLSIPIIAVMTLYNVVGRWNCYFEAMIFLKDKDLFPLQLVLKQLLINNQGQGAGGSIGGSQLESIKLMETAKFAIVIVATAPLLILFPFVSKYLKKGVMVGSLKG